MKVLLPIHIDRWRSPIASLLREIAIYNEDINFYSFSGPETNEDHEKAAVFWSLPNIFKLNPRKFGAISFDIVHTASATTANLTAIILAKIRTRSRCNHLYTANSEPTRDDPFYHQYRMSLQIADTICSVSHAVDLAIRQFGYKSDAIIPNGFDPAFFSPHSAHLDTPVKHDLDRPFFLFCGVIQKRKRPDVFISLAEKMPHFPFVMVGGYHFRNEAEPFIHRMERVKNIIILGKVTRTELRDLMAHATALIFPSESEGLPLSVIEASGMGLPVLAQPVSALPEVINEGTNGWLIPVSNLDDWMIRLLDITEWSMEQRKVFAENARKTSIDRFSWEKIAGQYGVLYRNMMHQN